MSNCVLRSRGSRLPCSIVAEHGIEGSTSRNITTPPILSSLSLGPMIKSYLSQRSKMFGMKFCGQHLKGTICKS
jgi:hypothetical protein